MLQTIWVPAAAGLLCLLLLRVKEHGVEPVFDWIRRLVMLLASGYVLWISFRLFLNPSAYYAFGTASLGPLSTRVIFRATPFGALMATFAGLFAFLTAIYSMRYRAGAEHNNWYYALALWTLASANGIFFSGDLFSFTILWELSTLFLFGLIALGDNEKSSFAAAKTLVVLGLAEAGMLFAVAYIWVTQGTLVFGEMHLPITSATNVVLFLLFAAAAIAKAGAIPLHSWIPTAAEGAPTVVMAYLPASVDKLLGIFFLFISSYTIFTLTPGLRLLLMIIGVVTIIVAVLMAMMQHDLRRLLSFHAISQVGYMVLGIGTGNAVGILGGLFHMVNHAIYKSCLFLCAGAVEKHAGTTELERLGGLGRKMPLLFFANVVAAFAISGVIPFNGFISKWLVYQGCVLAGQPVMFILAVFGSGLTLASFIKVLHSVYMGPLPPELEDVKAPGFALTFPPFVLALLCILFGIVPGIPLGKLLVPSLLAAAPDVMGSLSQNAVFGTFSVKVGSSFWGVGWAVILMFTGFVIGWIYYAAGRALKTRRDKAFVGGIEPGTLAGYHVFTNEAMRVPGTGFYNTLKELPILKSLLPEAVEGAFDPYNYVSRIGEALFVRPLKALHNGVLSSYLSWVVIGIVVVFIVLIR